MSEQLISELEQMNAALKLRSFSSHRDLYLETKDLALLVDPSSGIITLTHMGQPNNHQLQALPVQILRDGEIYEGGKLNRQGQIALQRVLERGKYHIVLDLANWQGPEPLSPEELANATAMDVALQHIRARVEPDEEEPWPSDEEEAAVWKTEVCAVCGESFRTVSGSVCYKCNLDRITGGRLG